LKAKSSKYTKLQNTNAQDVGDLLHIVKMSLVVDAKRF